MPSTTDTTPIPASKRDSPATKRFLRAKRQIEYGLQILEHTQLDKLTAEQLRERQSMLAVGVQQNRCLDLLIREARSSGPHVDIYSAYFDALCDSVGISA